MANRHLLRVRAPAKLNLSLRVLRKTPDRYHEIRTVVQSIALHDTLTFAEHSGPFRIECDDAACPTDSTRSSISALPLGPRLREVGA